MFTIRNVLCASESELLPMRLSHLRVSAIEVDPSKASRPSVAASAGSALRPRCAAAVEHWAKVLPW
jgi:hypothetical protein